MDDFYGDRGGAPYPKIEELQILLFKKKCRYRDKIHSLPKQEEQVLIEKIKSMRFGSVELVKYSGMGTYIRIDMAPTFEELCGFNNNSRV